MELKALEIIDFYKSSHREQYPEGTSLVYSNFTPRSGRLAPVLKGQWDEKGVVFGIQYLCLEFLIRLFDETFFNVDKGAVVIDYERRMDTALGKNVVPTDHIEALHDLGYLPIEIKALPEGSVAPMKVPVLTIKNTLPEFFWLVNYLETLLSNVLWHPITVATIAREYKRLLTKYAEETGASKDFIPFQAHDFSYRGVSNPYSAAATAGHLLSFVGTDTVPAIGFMESYYAANAERELIGCSVAATEHSVMCMGGQEDEVGTFKRLINDLYPSGIVSIVSDTWDFWKVVTEYVNILKSDILAREGKVVIRPDSGDPVKIICGYVEHSFDSLEEAVDEINEIHFEQASTDCEGSYNIGNNEYSTVAKVGDKYYEFTTPFEYNRHAKTYYYIDNFGRGKGDTTYVEVNATAEMKGAIECLWDVFGGTVNAKGFKELDPHIGLIYGDSITLERAQAILEGLKQKGFASSNIVFGVGSFTYQHVTRDSFGFAMKATYGVVNGEGREIFKDPATDSGTKKSAKGLLRVDLVDGEYVLKDQCTVQEEQGGCLEMIFIDGMMMKWQTLAEIRDRVCEGL
jgi:nicotinamide phosphoribosyltransferase